MAENHILCCGANGEVTGSMHLLVLDGKKILLDAGAFQGVDAKTKNSTLPPMLNPAEVDCIFLSHAHYDHVGRLPVLCQRGFNGEIISTPATREITFRLLDDSLKIQKEEGDDQLFGEEDVAKVKRLFSDKINSDYPEWQDNEKKIKVKFIPSEHILGSASILFEEPVSFLYTSDLGGGRSSLHSTPKPPDTCDYLMIESTYGNRELEKSQEDILLQLKSAVESIRKEKAKLLIPVFAIDRAEEILYLLRELKVKERVYLDTPMGADILDIYSEEKYLLSKISEQFATGNMDEFKKIFRPDKFERVGSRKRSEELASSDESCIVLASSGMLEGGRILGHLPYFLPEEKNILLFTGYQAEGTRGRLILDGAKEIDVDGQTVQVKARIKKIEGLSAHADKTALLSYIDRFRILPSKVFIVHGERSASQELAEAIQQKFRIRTVIPEYNTKYDLLPCEVREKVVVKDILNAELLRFESIAGKSAAPFAGWIIKSDNGYSLASQNEIEGMLRDSIASTGFNGNAISKVAISKAINSSWAEPVVNGPPPSPDELIKTLIEYYQSGYISKSLIKSLIEAVERGTAEYRKVVEKRIKGRDLLLDDIEIGRRGKSLSQNKRDEIMNSLADLLKRCVNMDPKTLHSSLTAIRDEIKDM